MHFANKISAKPFPGLRLKSFSVLSLMAFIVFQESFAQITDDFSNALNPSWSGTRGDFIINADQQLQLNATAAGTAWLLTELPGPRRGGMEWTVFIRQSFSPSAANFGRVYLSSDQPNLTNPLNGYYLQFGESGSADAVELFRQSGATVTSVCRASASRIANAFGIRVKVIRHEPGSWQLFIDYNGGMDFLLEGVGDDAVHPVSGFFGLRCTYTITNATRFYFDDVSVKTFDLPDTAPPLLTSLEILSGNALAILFSEPMQASSLTLSDFFVEPGPGHPTHIQLSEDQRTVRLNFSDPLENGPQSLLRVSDVNDLAGNTLVPAEIAFTYFRESPSSFKDIIITEILADPGPVQELPEAEFLELYNRSENPINLAGWVLSDESTSVVMNRFILLPRQYLILTASKSAEAYSMLGLTLSLSSLPSLNNAGDLITLRNPGGITIDSLRYNLSWYRDDEKSDGGWTLELIDIDNICDDGENWIACESLRGGTPGEQNSVFATRPDHIGPGIVSAVPLDSSKLLIFFDEKLDAKIPDIAQVVVQPLLNIRSMELDPLLRQLTINFEDYVQGGIVYTITLHDIYDCPGNKIRPTHASIDFILPQKAVTGDVVVNEILFNPRPTGVDFVEVYNRSEKIIDLKDWSLRNYSTSEEGVSASQGHLLFRPGEYLVLTEASNVLKGEYLSGVESTFHQIDLPALNDYEGSIALLDENGRIIDSVFYAETMHTPFLKSGEGVSLERISFAGGSVESANWRSASSTTAYATPGFTNSNSRLNSDIEDESVIIEPEVLQLQTPTHEYARIRYRFTQGGFIANVKIYDQQGRSVRELASNELLGTEGFFRWDGDCDTGGLAGRGYYVVWFEIFSLSGTTKTFRKRIAVF